MTPPREYTGFKYWWRSRDPLTRLFLGLAALLVLAAVAADLAWWLKP